MLADWKYRVAQVTDCYKIRQRLFCEFYINCFSENGYRFSLFSQITEDAKSEVKDTWPTVCANEPDDPQYRLKKPISYTVYTFDININLNELVVFVVPKIRYISQNIWVLWKCKDDIIFIGIELCIYKWIIYHPVYTVLRTLNSMYCVDD